MKDALETVKPVRLYSVQPYDTFWVREGCMAFSSIAAGAPWYHFLVAEGTFTDLHWEVQWSISEKR